MRRRRDPFRGIGTPPASCNGGQDVAMWRLTWVGAVSSVRDGVLAAMLVI